MPARDFLSLLDALRPAARAAGARQMALWRRNIAVERKADGSPVTEADRAGHETMAEALAILTPDLALVSEEGMVPATTPGATYWMLDPLDGTKSFLRGDPDFVLCLALIDQGRAVAGLMHAPAHDLTAWGARGQGVFLEQGGAIRPADLRRLSPETLRRDGLDLLIPSSHPTPRVDAHLNGMAFRSRTPLSSAMKFLRILEGEADAYLRFELIQQWDIAAGDALLNAAGGDCCSPEGAPILYGADAQGRWRSEAFIATARDGFAALQQLRAEATDA